MAKATAIFDADDSRMARAFKNIDRGLIGIQAKFAAVAKTAAVMLAAPAAVLTAGAVGMKRALDLGGELADLSANTGASVKSIAILQREFANAGKSAGDVGPVISKMLKTISGGKSDTFSKLGLDLAKIQSMTPDEQFRAIGAAIAALPSPAERTAAAMDIFGKSGGTLLALFASGGFGDAAQQVGNQAEILDRNAALFDDVSDKLNLAGEKASGFFVGVAEKVAPVLKPLLDRFAAMDLSALGQQAGDLVAFVVQAFADGKIGEIVFLSAQLGLARLTNVLAGVFTALGAALWTIFRESITNGITLLQIVTTTDFWKGMGNALMSIAEGFVSMLIEGIAMLLDQLADVPVIGDELAGAAASARSLAGGLAEESAMHAAAADEVLDPALAKVTARMSAMLGSVGSSLADGFATGASLIDTGSMVDKLGDVVGSVLESAQRATAASLAGVKPVEPMNLSAALDDQAAGKGGFSALQRIGGAAAGRAADPLIEANKLAREGNWFLKRIEEAVRRRSDASAGMAEFSPA